MKGIGEWHQEHHRDPAPGFGAELDALIARTGITQSAAALRIGCDASYLSRLRSGSRVPTPEIVAAIIDGLGLSADEGRRLSVIGGFVPPEMRDVVLQLVPVESVPILDETWTDGEATGHLTVGHDHTITTSIVDNAGRLTPRVMRMDMDALYRMLSATEHAISILNRREIAA